MALSNQVAAVPWQSLFLAGNVAAFCLGATSVLSELARIMWLLLVDKFFFFCVFEFSCSFKPLVKFKKNYFGVVAVLWPPLQIYLALFSFSFLVFPLSRNSDCRYFAAGGPTSTIDGLLWRPKWLPQWTTFSGNYPLKYIFIFLVQKIYFIVLWLPMSFFNSFFVRKLKRYTKSI